MRILLEIRGVESEFANNGEEAIEKFVIDDFDAIFMDINMPVMGGVEATKHINNLQKEYEKRTPIIALTANAIKGDKERFLSEGMDDYLTKPISEEELDRVLQKYLEVVEAKAAKEKTQSKKTKGEFEFEKYASSLGLPTELYLEIVEAFMQSIDEDIKELEAALKSGNKESIKEASHKIKGAASNLKFETIAKRAKVMLDGLLPARIVWINFVSWLDL